MAAEGERKRRGEEAESEGEKPSSRGKSESSFSGTGKWMHLTAASGGGERARKLS